MSNPETVLLTQEKQDQLFANAARLSQTIKAFQISKKVANVDGPVIIDDLLASDKFYTHVAGIYKPFLSSLGIWVKKQVSVLPGTGERTIEFSFDSANASFTGEIVMVVRFPRITLNDLVLNNGATIAPSAGNGQIRYCNYPGLRLFEEVSLVVSGRDADRYTWENAFEYMEHELPIGKLSAFKRCVGQEEPKTGRFAYSLNAEAQPINGVQFWSQYTDGPQTPKNEQDELIMAIPLLFTWCRDPTIPLSNIALNPTQRSIKIKLANLANIVSHYVNYPVAILADTFRYTEISVYTKSIFMNADVSSLMNYPHKTIVRSWKTVRTLDTRGGDDEIDLREIVYPIEIMYARPIPNENRIVPQSQTLATVSTYDNYFIPGLVTRQNVPISFIGLTSSSIMFQNALVYQTNNYRPVIASFGFRILETDFYNGAAPYLFLESLESFIESSSALGIDESIPITSAVINFSRTFSGDISRGINGYIDFSLFDGKYLTWENSFASTIRPVSISLSIRYINFYEPKGEGLIQFHYSI